MSDLRELELERRKRKEHASNTHPAAGETAATAGVAAALAPWKEGDCSLTVAYGLLFFAGPLGVHHLYLDRPLQAFIWACSPCLGFFGGVGLLRDAVSLPGYVAVRSACRGSAEQLEVQMKYRKVPPWSFSRMIAALMFGSWCSSVGNSFGFVAMPDVYFKATSTLAGALGVWLVGCACTHQGGSLKATVAGSVVGRLLGDWSLCVAVVAFQWTRCWQPECTKHRLPKWKVVFAVMVFWSAVCAGVWEHGKLTVDTSSGPKTYTVKDGILNILRGINFDDFKRGFESSESDSNYDWQSRWKKFQSTLDASGERRALRTLGMESFIGKPYAVADVKRHYREMARSSHPDRAELGQRNDAESKMQEINAAKELLDGLLGATKG